MEPDQGWKTSFLRPFGGFRGRWEGYACYEVERVFRFAIPMFKAPDAFHTFLPTLTL